MEIWISSICNICNIERISGIREVCQIYGSSTWGTAETIDKEYNAIVSAAKEQNIDISKYTQIVTDGADYVASNYAWETAGYFWEINTLNQEIDEGATIDDVSKVVNSGNVSTFGKRRECYQKISSSYDEYYSD